jgi:flagellin
MYRSPNLHRLEINISDMAATGILLNLGSLSTSTLAASRSAIRPIDLAIDKVTKTRGDLAAVQNCLSFSMRAHGVMLENDQASDSAIRDADIATEVSAFSPLLRSTITIARVLPFDAMPKI